MRTHGSKARGVTVERMLHRYYPNADFDTRTSQVVFGRAVDGPPWLQIAPASYEVAFEARAGDKLVGLLLGTMRFPRSRDERPEWHSHQTLVLRSWQRRGLGSLLWETMLCLERPKAAYVAVASDRGLTLIRRLERVHPDVEWKVDALGDRKLRVLGG